MVLVQSSSLPSLGFVRFREEDVSRTMYPTLDKLNNVCERGKEEEVEEGGRKKVDNVCDAVREALVELGENK